MYWGQYNGITFILETAGLLLKYNIYIDVKLWHKDSSYWAGSKLVTLTPVLKWYRFYWPQNDEKPSITNVKSTTKIKNLEYIKILSSLTVFFFFLFPVLLVDIWNIIEAFRENGLNTLEPDSELNVSRLETILSSIFHQLNKRLPSSQQISVDQSVNLLLNWLISAYDRFVLTSFG